MWLYGLLPLGAQVIQSAALGGSAITPQAGTAKANGTVALSGEASTCSAGTLVANSAKALAASNSPLIFPVQYIECGMGNVGVIADDSTALFGSSSTFSAGSVLVPRSFALSGTASTTGIGTVVAGNRPTTITTTALVPAAGTLVFEQAGDPVTVNLNAGEMEMVAETGFMNTSSALSTQVITSAAGTMVANNVPDATLQGMQITSAMGSLGVQSDVEDTFIQSSHGAIAIVESYPITGIESVCGQGTLTPSGDVELFLVGEQAVFATGSFADFSNEFALTGQEILVQQDDGGFGLPEEITLTGIESVVSAGNVFLNDDRDYPLIGEQVLVQDGITFASSLAFLSNNLITTEQEQIGPVSTELTGQQIDMGQYQFDIKKDHGAGDPGKGKGRDKPRKTVIVDDQVFEVNDEELEDLVKAVQEVATAKAKEEADAAVAALVAAKSDGKVRLKVPSVTGSEELKDAITDVYMQAQIDAQVALEVSRARQLDEEEAIVLLLVN